MPSNLPIDNSWPSLELKRKKRELTNSRLVKILFILFNVTGRPAFHEKACQEATDVAGAGF